MAINQLAEPLPLNTIVPGTEEDAWGEPVNDNWVLIRQSVVDLLAADALKADLVGGVVPSDQLPPLNAIAVETVANQAARLALSGPSVGKAVLQADNGNIYILSALPSSTNGNWTPVNPGTAVTSVNGETGAVTGYAKTNANGLNFTGTTPAFSAALSVGAATSSSHAIQKAQLESAIAAVAGSSFTRSSFLVGNGSATSFNVDHNKNTLGVDVFAQDVDTGKKTEVEVTYSTVNRVIVTTVVAPATNKLRVWCN